ncbi:MAG: hypothetical protein IT257_01720 [Chitinophagaceae bacterium]|nr:hypothetical protein [Chitinophagaceae bacterium]
MMKIGLIGSAAFYNTYQQELSKHQEVTILESCSTADALADLPVFNQIISHGHYLFFEEIDHDTYPLAIAGLKNGKHLVIENAAISAAEMHELYQISIEGNLKCLIIPPPEQYHIFDPLKNKFNNPYLVELSLGWPQSEPYHLTDHLAQTLNLCIQFLRSIFKSEIRQINVKQIVLFSGKTDLIVVQLDFSSGSMVQIKLSTIDREPDHRLKVYQKSAVIDITINQQFAVITEIRDDQLQTNRINLPTGNIIEKKVAHLLNFVNDHQNSGSSALENYLTLELSAKILKKMNSLYD